MNDVWMPVWHGLILLTMVVGLIGLVIPIFPGNVVIWLAALAYGFSVDFALWGYFAGITALMLIAVVADNLAMSWGAARGGASWWSIALAIGAALVGTMMYPPLGGLIAGPLVLLIAEYARQRDWRLAWQASKGYLIGCGWAFVVRFLLGVLMIAVWALWAWQVSS